MTALIETPIDVAEAVKPVDAGASSGAEIKTETSPQTSAATAQGAASRRKPTDGVFRPLPGGNNDLVLRKELAKLEGALRTRRAGLTDEECRTIQLIDAKNFKAKVVVFRLHQQQNWDPSSVHIFPHEYPYTAFAAGDCVEPRFCSFVPEEVLEICKEDGVRLLVILPGEPDNVGLLCTTFSYRVEDREMLLDLNFTIGSAANVRRKPQDWWLMTMRALCRVRYGPTDQAPLCILHKGPLETFMDRPMFPPECEPPVQLLAFFCNALQTRLYSKCGKAAAWATGSAEFELYTLWIALAESRFDADVWTTQDCLERLKSLLPEEAKWVKRFCSRYGCPVATSPARNAKSSPGAQQNGGCAAQDQPSAAAPVEVIPPRGVLATDVMRNALWAVDRAPLPGDDDLAEYLSGLQKMTDATNLKNRGTSDDAPARQAMAVAANDICSKYNNKMIAFRLRSDDDWLQAPQWPRVSTTGLRECPLMAFVEGGGGFWPSFQGIVPAQTLEVCDHCESKFLVTLPGTSGIGLVVGITERRLALSSELPASMANVSIPSVSDCGPPWHITATTLFRVRHQPPPPRARFWLHKGPLIPFEDDYTFYNGGKAPISVLNLFCLTVLERLYRLPPSQRDVMVTVDFDMFTLWVALAERRYDAAVWDTTDCMARMDLLLPEQGKWMREFCRLYGCELQVTGAAKLPAAEVAAAKLIK